MKSGEAHTNVAEEKLKTRAVRPTEPRAVRYVPVNTQNLQEAETEIIRNFQSCSTKLACSTTLVHKFPKIKLNSEP